MKKLILLFSTALLFIYAKAQPGALDLSFLQGSGIAGIDQIECLVIQPDGKIIIGGYLSEYDGATINHFCRLNSNGTLQGLNSGTGFDNSVTEIALQTDEKILVGGLFQFYSGTPANRIIRLNSNGTADNTFNTGTGLDNSASAITIQPDGKIIVGGMFTSYNGTTRKGIVRVNTNGSIDTTFNPGTGINSGKNIYDIELQSDGKIIAVGNFTSYNGFVANNIVRINTDGTFDSTFIMGTGFSSAVGTYTVAIQPDDKIIVSTSGLKYNSVNLNARTLRLNSDGTLDILIGSFSQPQGKDIKIQSDGKIIVAGYGIVVRFDSTGTIDPDFVIGDAEMLDAFGTYISGQTNSVAITQDGKIIVGGVIDAYNSNTSVSGIVRLFGSAGTGCDAQFTVSPSSTPQLWYAVNQATGTAPLTYSWNWGDGSANSSGAYPSHTYSSAGNYNICLTITDGNGCTDTYCDSSTYIYKTEGAAITLDVVAQLPNGVEELDNHHFSIYPNPTNNLLNITTTLQGNNETQYQIINTLGATAMANKATAKDFSIDVSALPSGIYFIHLQRGNAQTVKRFVKE